MRHPPVKHPLGATIRAAAVGAAGLLAMSGTAQEQLALLVEDAVETTATVTAVDPETRLVSLESEDGREFTVLAGEDVRNFEQIDVGDRVDVLFYEALAAEVTEARASAGNEPVVIEARRAPLGADPSGAVGMVYTAVVTIDEVDPDSNMVRFTGPQGLPREVTVERPEVQEFIRELSAGDRVQVTYGEALAVSVTPAE